MTTEAVTGDGDVCIVTTSFVDDVAKTTVSRNHTVREVEKVSMASKESLMKA